MANTSPESSSRAHDADLQLARRALAGEPEALSALEDRLACVPAMVRARHARMAVTFCEAELDEIVQATLYTIWTKLPSYSGKAALETWAYGIGVFELLRSLQVNARRRPTASLEEARDVAAPAEDPEVDGEALADALDRAGEGADIVRLRHYEQLSFEQIGRKLRVPKSTVKTRYYRTLDRLRAILIPAELLG